MEGLISETAHNQTRKIASKQVIADQNTFCIDWFLINLQNIPINLIHFNIILGRLIQGAYNQI